MADTEHQVVTEFTEYIVNLLDPACLQVGLVGGKGANLAKIASITNINTKPGYVITSKLYNDVVFPKISHLLSEINEQNIEEMCLKIREIILDLNISYIFLVLGELLDTDKYFAVRSSATIEDSNKASFSGKFESHLYIQKREIVAKIKEVWLSIFTVNNYDYCKENNIEFRDICMAVVIQEMSHSLAAGTVFADTNKIEIDVAPGLGEAVVRGDKPTDKIILNLLGSIVFNEVSSKQDKLMYDNKVGCVISQSLSRHEKNILCMTMQQINELYRQVSILRNVYQECQNGIDVEFSCDQDSKVYIVQVRPVTVPTLENTQQVDFIKVKKFHIGDGEPVSYHIASGILIVCSTPEYAAKQIDKYNRWGKKTILVVENTTSQWESVMRRSSGIIAETGSSNCHTAIACREMNIPGITGYTNAMQHLREYQDQIITLCGISGKVYLGDFSSQKYLIQSRLSTKYTPIETEQTMPKEKHIHMARAAGMTITHKNKIWIGKPITPTCQLVNELDMAAHYWVAKEILKIGKPELHITDSHVLLMDFDDCHEWRVVIRGWEIDFHKNVLNLRIQAEKEFLEASENLLLTESSILQWYHAYQKKIGFDNIAFAIGEVLTGLLHQEAERKGVKEPVLSDLIPAQVAILGHFLLQECERELGEIQYILKNNKEAYELVKRLEELYDNKSGHESYIEIEHIEAQLIIFLKELNIYEKCKAIATSYRIQEKDFSLTFLEPWFQNSSAPWLRLLIASKKLTGPIAQPLAKRKRTYYPHDENIRELIELAAASKKLHMDGHHTKARGMWQFIKILQQLSQNTGYPINDFISGSKEDILKCIREMHELTRPGAVPRQFSQNAQEKFEKFESDQKRLSENSIKKYTAFCDILPSEQNLEAYGYKKSVTRRIFQSKNKELPLQLEEFERQMSDNPAPIARGKYRGEYVRPDYEQFTQHQIIVSKDRVVTAVHHSQGKPELQLDDISLGKTCAYSAHYKWENPSFRLDPAMKVEHEHYERIKVYSQIIDQNFCPEFSQKSLADKIAFLNIIKDTIENSNHFFGVSLNTNLKTERLEIKVILYKLLQDLNYEYHMQAIFEKPSSIIYGYDGAVPAMQSVVRIPSAIQHEIFLENALYFINKNLKDVGSNTTISQEELLAMNEQALSYYLEEINMNEDDFIKALIEARKFREYERKPKLRAIMEDNTIVEIGMNDSIDIPSQALMMLSAPGNIIETNRTVNLAKGYQALITLLQAVYDGNHQDIIFSNLAYTQASSTQSMCHFHIAPIYNSEGLFIIPYLDEDTNFEEFQETNIEKIQAAYLKQSALDDYFNLVKFKFKLSRDEAENLRLLELLNQKLQIWETKTGCDMTWVAKFNTDKNEVIICVELRAGISKYTQMQIDDFRERNLWLKIGFTEVMGKKYSMLSQRNLDDAAQIYKDCRYDSLKRKMLNTPLYCVQISPEGEKTFYPFEDDVSQLKSENRDKRGISSILHIARILQMYDAQAYTHTMAAMYHLNEAEWEEFKALFVDSPSYEESSAPQFMPGIMRK